MDNKVSQKEKLPDWVPIYFMLLNDNKYKCNICDSEVDVTEKCLELVIHLQGSHKEVYELHKDSSDAGVGYQIEFLQFNMKDVDLKSDSVILGEICETPAILKDAPKEELDQSDFLLLPNKQEEKHTAILEQSRKRSWVWKYFEQLTKTIYRCSLCSVVLSIKGSNSNNMNRHIRTRHSAVFASEISTKGGHDDDVIGVSIKWDTPKEESLEKVAGSARTKKPRRSWVWSYFSLVSRTRARCKLCKRVISHGGNATGNMNRHLKIVHNKRGDGSHWVWKVFDVGDDTYSCKICQYEFIKFDDLEKSIQTILDHLKNEHSVISGSQIITSATFELNND